MGAGSHKATVILDGRAEGLNAAAKSSDKALGKLEDSVARLEQRLRKAEGQANNFDEAVRKSGERVRKTTEIYGGAGAGGRGLLGRLDSMVQVGRGVIDTFGAMGRAANDLAAEGVKADAVYGALPFSVHKAELATGGFVSKLDLATLAVNANRLKLGDSAEEYARFTGAAVKLGQSAGVTAKSGIESLVAGLGRGSTEMLDNLGVVLKMEEAYRVYAGRLNRTVASLDANERAEAFRKVGMERIIEAAEGLTLKTDGAASAVQRFNVELSNIKSGALASVDGTRSLEEGLAKVSLKTRIQSEGVRNYGADLFDLKDALRDVGVSSEELDITQGDLADALDRSRLQQKSRIKSLLIEGKTTDELVGKMKDLLAVDFELSDTERELFDRRIKAFEGEQAQSGARVAEIEQELRFNEDQLAFLAGAQNDEANLNNILAQQAELKAELLDLEGKTGEAAKVRRDAELTATRQAGEKLRKRGGGGRRREVQFDLDAVFGDTERALSRINAQARRAQTALERSGKGAAKRFAELVTQIDRGREAMEGLGEVLLDIGQRATPDPFDLDAFRTTTERALELDQARAELLLEQRLRQIDELRSAGADPITLMEEETEARLELIDVQAAAANDSMQLMQLADQREAVLHDNKMERLAEERIERNKTQDTINGIVNQATELGIAAGQSLAQKVIFEKKSLRESVKNVAATEGAKQAIVAISEGIRAAVAFASYQYPKGAQHLANAAVAAGFAATMAATYGIASIGGGGGGGRSVSGLGASAFGGGTSQGGGAANGPGGSSSSPRSGTSPDIPNSPGPSPQTAAGQAAGQSTGPTIIIQGDVIGTPKPEFVQAIDKGLRDLQFGGRRVSNG